MLVPTLISSPMTVFNVRALTSLVTVAGNALSKRFSAILRALVKASEVSDSEDLSKAIDQAINTLVRSVTDPECLDVAMVLLLDW